MLPITRTMLSSKALTITGYQHKPETSRRPKENNRMMLYRLLWRSFLKIILSINLDFNTSIVAVAILLKPVLGNGCHIATFGLIFVVCTYVIQFLGFVVVWSHPIEAILFPYPLVKKKPHR